MEKPQEFSENISERSVLGIEPPEHFFEYGTIVTINNKITILRPLEKYSNKEGELTSKEAYDIFASYNDKIISELQERGIKNTSFEAPYGVSWRHIHLFQDNEGPKKISVYGSYYPIEDELYKVEFKIEPSDYKKISTSKYDQLHALKALLPENPRVLYIGSGRDFSLQPMFPDMIHLDPAHAMDPAPEQHILLSSVDFFENTQVRQLAENNGPFDLCIFSNFMFYLFYDKQLFDHLKLVMNDHGMVYNSHGIPATSVDIEKQGVRDASSNINLLEEQKDDTKHAELNALILAHRISSNFQKFGFLNITPEDFPTQAQVYKL